MENEPLIPPEQTISPLPSPKAQSWGAVISIIVIVLMIIIGAFYAWGQRIAQVNPPIESSAE
jgi:hypothetical protein